mmetsp:Transcript_39885/g.103249  ORF Transcript_39885/g.103249 Transcript_39885/m.103249 type:complete len:85 (+) Transcript_39885:266-520(+)
MKRHHPPVSWMLSRWVHYTGQSRSGAPVFAYCGAVGFAAVLVPAPVAAPPAVTGHGSGSAALAAGGAVLYVGRGTAVEAADDEG